MNKRTKLIVSSYNHVVLWKTLDIFPEDFSINIMVRIVTVIVLTPTDNPILDEYETVFIVAGITNGTTTVTADMDPLTTDVTDSIGINTIF